MPGESPLLSRSGKGVPMSKVAKSRLGRGLSSLISVSEAPVHVDASRVPIEAISPALPASAVGAPLEVDVEKITANPHQPRKNFNDAAIAELAATVRTTGVIQPIVVRRDGD